MGSSVSTTGPTQAHRSPQPAPISPTWANRSQQPAPTSPTWADDCIQLSPPTAPKGLLKEVTSNNHTWLWLFTHCGLLFPCNTNQNLHLACSARRPTCQYHLSALVLSQGKHTRTTGFFSGSPPLIGGLSLLLLWPFPAQSLAFSSRRCRPHLSCRWTS